MPDNLIFGRPVFTRDQAKQLMTLLRGLLGQAEQKAFGPGIAAVIALQAVASLIMLDHEATFTATRRALDRELTAIGAHMEHLLAIHRAASP